MKQPRVKPETRRVKTTREQQVRQPGTWRHLSLQRAALPRQEAAKQQCLSTAGQKMMPPRRRMIASLMLESPVALVPVREKRAMQGGARREQVKEVDRLDAGEIGAGGLAVARVHLRPLEDGRLR